MSVPFSYAELNATRAFYSPNQSNIHDNYLSFYFRRYLMLDAISLTKATIPKTWDRNRYLYLLFACGSVAVFKTDRFGIIYDHPAYSGYNVFYNPTHATIANPLIIGGSTLQIGRQCEIVKLKPDYTGIADIIAYYGDLMALASQTLMTNLQNSKLAYVFMAHNQAGAESFKQMFDNIMAGEPSVVVDSALEQERAAARTGGRPANPWMYFAQDLRGNFIAPELLDVLRALKDSFDTDVGIPNANRSKKERLSVDEVNANNVETTAKASIMLETLQESCERCHRLFPELTRENLWFEWRFPEVAQVEGGAQNGNSMEAVNSRSVSVR